MQSPQLTAEDVQPSSLENPSILDKAINIVVGVREVADELLYEDRTLKQLIGQFSDYTGPFIKALINEGVIDADSADHLRQQFLQELEKFILNIIIYRKRMNKYGFDDHDLERMMLSLEFSTKIPRESDDDIPIIQLVRYISKKRKDEPIARDGSGSVTKRSKHNHKAGFIIGRGCLGGQVEEDIQTATHPLRKAFLRALVENGKSAKKEVKGKRLTLKIPEEHFEGCLPPKIKEDPILKNLFMNILFSDQTITHYNDLVTSGGNNSKDDFVDFIYLDKRT